MPQYGSPCWDTKARQPVFTHLPRKLGEMTSLACSPRRAFRKRNRQTSRQPRSALLAVAHGSRWLAPTKKENKKSRHALRTCLFIGSPCWARTSDNLINSQVLIPTELRRNIQGSAVCSWQTVEVYETPPFWGHRKSNKGSWVDETQEINVCLNL